MDGILYKVNITALVEDCRVTESKGQESARMSVESSGFAESKARKSEYFHYDYGFA